MTISKSSKNECLFKLGQLCSFLGLQSLNILCILGVQGREDVGSPAFHYGLKIVSKNEIKMHKDAEMTEVMEIMVVLEVQLHSLFFWLFYISLNYK